MRVRRTHSQLFLHLVVLTTGLSLVVGFGVWWWVDAVMRRQAAESAGNIGEVLGEGGFALNQRVRQRMEMLTGYRFEIDPPSEAPAEGTVTVQAGGHVVRVDYRTEAYHQARQEVLVALLAALILGAGVALMLAWGLARRYARPVERLAAVVRRLGAGDWEEAVAADHTSAELSALSADIDGLRCRLRSLTEQQRLNERLSTLGSFTATIAHEVRNPLSAVQLSVQLLQRRLGPDEHLDLVRAELERLELTVDELLAFSRGMDVTLQACDLAAVAADVCRLLERQARHAGVSLAVIGEGRFQVDPQRMRQLLLNLVLNAIQVQHGGGAVSITITGDGLEVLDRGPGVSDDLRLDLFQAFSSHRPGGTGLGLHLAASIAEAHGALLTCEANRPEGGACFRLSGLAAASVEAS